MALDYSTEFRDSKLYPILDILGLETPAELQALAQLLRNVREGFPDETDWMWTIDVKRAIESSVNVRGAVSILETAKKFNFGYNDVLNSVKD